MYRKFKFCFLDILEFFFPNIFDSVLVELEECMNTKGDGLLFTDRLNLHLSNSGMKKKNG